MKISKKYNILLILFILFSSISGLAYGEVQNQKEDNKVIVELSLLQEIVNEKQPIPIGGKICEVIIGNKDFKVEALFLFIYQGLENNCLKIRYSCGKFGVMVELAVPLNENKQALIQPYLFDKVTMSKLLITVVDSFGSIDVKKIDNYPAKEIKR